MAEWSKAPDSSSGLRERAWGHPLLHGWIFRAMVLPPWYKRSKVSELEDVTEEGTRA
ncbi:hypothetical protein MTR_4g072100 [Medicago truncatula]|uniref:Uncharacterized protein n=1 Tax=Medicago truncatula TaxID=3880 RepID=G7JL06_MEDTR|nr:hypothetical protein MTR_4g072100 [Medicago truncatula]